MRIAVFLAAFLIFAAPAFAAQQFCTDTSTLLTANESYDGSSWTNVTSYQPCPSGCNNITFSCNPDPVSGDSAAFYFLFPITAFVLLFMVAFTANPIEDWPLYLLAIGVSFLLIIIPFGTLSASMPAQFTGAYQLLAIGLVVIMVYYIFILLTRAVKHAQRRT